MPTTIADVAQRAGVSARTVVRVLTNASYVSARTRTRVLQVAEELDFTPDDAVRRPTQARTGIIGLAFPYTSEFVFGDPNLLVFMRGIEQMAAGHGFNLLLFPARQIDDPASGVLRLLETPYIDGAIIVNRYDIEVTHSRFRHRAVPVVTLGYRSPWGVDNTVHANNRQGALYATRRLIDLGHRRIGVIDAAVPLADLSERLAGYKQALVEARLPFKLELVAHGDLTESSGAAAAAQLLALAPPLTALFAFNDRMAMGAIHQIKATGLRVPADIAVVGFDDIPLAGLFDPPLTTVRQPAQEMGATAARMIIGLIEGKIARFPEVSLPALLVVRESCGGHL